MTLIDVRTAEEHSFGTIPGAVNIPVDELRNRLDEIPTDKPVVLFCAVGLRGYLALRILTGTDTATCATLPAATRHSPRQRHRFRRPPLKTPKPPRRQAAATARTR